MLASRAPQPQAVPPQFYCDNYSYLNSAVRLRGVPHIRYRS
jgi:hypothetical protein